MPMMKALRKSGGQVAVCSLHVPPVADDEVRVRVRLAGLCRTDVQVARGELTGADPITLGHEFAGEIDAVGREVRRLTPGARVAIQPVLGCRTCGVCRAGDEINCPDRTMLGVDHNGAFAEFVVVPARCVFVLPGSLGWPAAAYAEPVAAALAVFNAGIQPGQQGLVLGRNRFAVLLERLLRAHGFDQITVCEPDVVDGFRPPDNSQDFVIETELPDRTLEKMIAWARPGGTLVLKSRLHRYARFPLRPALLKQLTIRAVNYGSFARALALLAEERLDLDGLLGPVYPLEEFEQVFRPDRQLESAKQFFDPTIRHVRHCS